MKGWEDLVLDLDLIEEVMANGGHGRFVRPTYAVTPGQLSK